jgi:hypothetical protein
MAGPIMKSLPRKKSLLTPAAKAAALAGGGLAVAQSAGAAIVAANNLPISPPLGQGSTDWDVDGNGANDFRLWHATSTSWPYDSAGLDELNPARFVAPAARVDDGFAKLNAGIMVGPTLATGFKFFAAAQGAISMTVSGLIAGDATANGWAMNDTGYFGFKFTNVAGTHYGWGQVNIDGNPRGSGYTFLQAYYNDTPDTPIAVGATAIPEPSHVTMLALGAAGLAVWRRRRKH